MADNEMLCAKDPFTFKNILAKAGIEPRIAR